MGKDGSLAINKLIVLILIVLAVVLGIYFTYKIGLWDFIIQLPDEYGGNLTPSEIPDDCEVVVGRVGGGGFIRIVEKIGEYELKDTSLYLDKDSGTVKLDNEISLGVVDIFAGDEDPVIGRVNLEDSRIVLFDYVFDEDSYHYKNSDLGSLMGVSKSDLILLHNSFLHEKMGLICKSYEDAEMVELEKECYDLSCSLVGGECRKISDNDRLDMMKKSSFYMVENKIYSSDNIYTNLYMKTEYVRGAGSKTYIYLEDGGVFWIDKKVGELDSDDLVVRFYERDVIDNYKAISLLQGMFFDYRDNYFKTLDGSDLNLDVCQEGEISLGNLDCAGVESCCVKSGESLEDEELIIEDYYFSSDDVRVDSVESRVILDSDKFARFNFDIRNKEGGFFCYEARNNKGKLGGGIVEGSEDFNIGWKPSTENSFGFIAWIPDGTKRVFKFVKMEINSEYEDVVNDENFKKKVWRSREGDEFFVIMNPIGVKGMSSTASDFKIKVYDKSVDIQMFFQKEGESKKWHTLDCAGYGTDINLEDLDDSLTETIWKNECELE
jgi:hypothetical protein